MKLGLRSPFSSLLPVALCLSGVACSGANQNGVANPDGGGGSGPNENGPPHALGVIALGFEVEHPTSTTTSTSPSVVASFIPDATQLPPVCAKTISGCTVPTALVCNPGGLPPGCQTGQQCVFDANCEPVCQEECTLPCPTGQECYFATPTAQACRATATFDAGYLIFSGTTTPITLYPPYTFDATDSQGSLFSPGQPITVTAAGATAAGFAPFTESFTGTSLLQTTPSLALLSGAEVFGSGGFSVGWQPGTDAVTIGISGPGGAATCPATDSSGTFSVPPAVVTAVAQAPGVSGPLPTYGTATVTVSVTRQRLQETTNAKTVGSLPNAIVQPVGYLDLSTYSTESISVTGTIAPECPAGDTLCNDGCQNLLASTTDCGACGNPCSGTTYCSSGACVAGAACPTGYSRCSDGCQNTSDSDTDCGGCGISCSTGTYCSAGKCIAGSACSSGYTQCTDGCQYLLDSDTDCGACGHACATASGSFCSDGVCTSTTSCASGLTSCSGVCVNLLTSNEDCGECGVTCTSTQTCSDGVCTASSVCGSGEVNCTDGCQNLETSATDCGSCGNCCDGGTCSSGVCSETCATCETSAEGSACSSQYTACEGDSNCSSYATCMSGCTAGNTSCQSSCKSEYPTGATEAEALQSCICSSQCVTPCESDAYCTETL